MRFDAVRGAGRPGPADSSLTGPGWRPLASATRAGAVAEPPGPNAGCVRDGRRRPPPAWSPDTTSTSTTAGTPWQQQQDLCLHPGTPLDPITRAKPAVLDSSTSSPRPQIVPRAKPGGTPEKGVDAGRPAVRLPGARSESARAWLGDAPEPTTRYTPGRQLSASAVARRDAGRCHARPPALDPPRSGARLGRSTPQPAHDRHGHPPRPAARVGCRGAARPRAGGASRRPAPGGRGAAEGAVSWRCPARPPARPPRAPRARRPACSSALRGPLVVHLERQAAVAGRRAGSGSWGGRGALGEHTSLSAPPRR